MGMDWTANFGVEEELVTVATNVWVMNGAGFPLDMQFLCFCNFQNSGSLIAVRGELD